MEIMNAVIVVAVGIAIFIVMGLLNKHNQNYYCDLDKITVGGD